MQGGNACPDSAYGEGMTPDELDTLLDDMARSAATQEQPDRAPGLITVETNHWIDRLSVIRPTCATLGDGMRYRNIKILVASQFETRLLSREEAGDRGHPFRDLTPATRNIG
jgi:hypothetical protein